MFAKAQAASQKPVFAYVNADIILFDDLTASIVAAQKQHKEFLMIGQRWDASITTPLDFVNPAWKIDLQAHVRKTGTLHAPTGVDYFVFTRDLYPAIPNLALGRTSFDNWLVWKVIQMDKPVIDASKTVMAIHEDHDYSHIKGDKQAAFHGDEAKRNQALAGCHEGRVLFGWISSATYEMTIDFSVISRPKQQATAAQYRPMFEKIIDNGITMMSTAAAAPPSSVAGTSADMQPEQSSSAAIHQLIMRASTAVRANKNAEATDYFTAAAAEISISRALALAKLGRVEEVRDTLQAILDMKPGDVRATELLKRIDG
jgi:hypothetical protein